MKRNIGLMVLLLGLAVFSSGCIQYSDKLIIKDDLSGKYYLHYGISKEMLKDKGKEGGAPATEQKALELTKKDFERSYPSGTKLDNFSQEEKMGAEFISVDFSVDNIDKWESLLKEIDKISQAGEDKDKSGNPLFKNRISVSKSGDTIKVKRTLEIVEEKKSDKDKEKDKENEEMGKMMEQLVFGSIFLTYQVELPRDPKSSNATYTEGKTLTWHVPLLTLMNQKKVDLEFAF